MGNGNRLFSAEDCGCNSEKNMCHSTRTSKWNKKEDRGQSKKSSSFVTPWVTRSTKEMKLIIKQGTLLLIWILVLLQEVQSFNIAVDSSVLLRGDKNSYFGFSLTLHRNANGKSILVGAPRANSSHQRELYEPGAVLQCKVDPSGPCQQIKLDDQGNKNVRTMWRKYKEVKDGQWLGVSVNSQVSNDRSPAVVVCGHRWSDVRYKGHRFPNGVCYTINADLEFESVEKRLPLVKTGLQVTPDGMYYYSMGQMGLSTHFTKDGKDLLVGAVGMKDWRGGAVQYSQNEEKIITPPDSVPYDSYAGYSLSSGKFFHDGDTYMVIGAPRADNLGKVYIYSNDFDILSEVEGNQFGAYFGAAICVADINKDGLDDILIASPMFKQKYYDEGIVQIYMNQNMGAFLKQPDALKGSSAAGARFGTSLSCIGDINADSYPDIAVGAPYEDEGRGALYIYTGSRQGIDSEYSQKILAVEISHTLLGFGHTLSQPMDLDENGYSDLAVGAYESDEAVILYTRPVVYLSSEITFYPKQIEPGKPTCRHQGELQSCVSVSVVLKYTGVNLPETLDIHCTLEVDADKVQHGMSSRGEFRITSDKLTEIWTNTTTLAYGQPKQQEMLVVLNEKIIDVISPMQFRLNYSIVHRAEGNSPNKNALKPILDATKPPTITKGISFVKDCGTDNQCVTDLHINTKLLSGTFIVVGDSNYFTIQVEVHNDGEAAYLSEVTILFPRHLSFVRVRTSSQLDYKVACIPENTKGDTHLVLCEVGNPIPEQKTVIFQLTFDPSKVTENVKELNMTIEAATQSTEDAGKTVDNIKELTIPVEVKAELDVNALSRPEQFMLNKTLVHNGSDINQAFERNHTGPAVRYLIDIYNQGPGYLPLATVDVKIPIFTKHMKPILHISSVEAKASRRSRTIGVQCSRKLLHDQWANSQALTHTPERNHSQAESFDYLRVPNFNKYHQSFLSVAWNCSNTICATYICDINSMSVLDSVLISIDAEVDIEILKHYKEAVSFSITSSVLVNHTHLGTQKSSSHHVTTTLSYRRAAERPKLQIWPICVGVFCGLFILIAVIIILKKCGFFQRKELEELRRLMEQNAENEAMAHMLGEQDLETFVDSELELQFGFHLNHPSTFTFSNRHHPLANGHGHNHRNGFLPNIGHSQRDGHVNNGRA